MDNALKALGKTEEELRVGNYIALFGGRDLEGVLSQNVNPDGSKGEFFTKATDFDSDYTATGRLFVDWHHGMDGDSGAPRADDVLGYVDWSTAKADDIGLWVERVLHRRQAYMEYLEVLIEAGLIGSSSEAVPSLVEKADTGEITRWGLKRDGLTVEPMEPRMMTENAMVALKGLVDISPAVKSMLASLLESEPEAQPEVEAAAPTVDAAKTEASAPTVVVNVSGDATVNTAGSSEEFVTNTMEVTKMSDTENVQAPEQVEAPVVDVAAIAKEAADEAVKAYRKELEDEKGTDPAGVQVDGPIKAKEADKFKSLGDFLLAVARVSTPGSAYDERLAGIKSRDSFDDGGFSLNKAMGDEFVGGLAKAAAKARYAKQTGLAEGTPALGGFLVDTDRAGGIMQKVYDVGSLLQRADMVGISANSNGMTFPAINETSRADGSRQGGIRAYWTAEAGTKTASKPEFRKLALSLNKVVGLVYSTDELLSDAPALESWIMNNLPEELNFVVEDAMVNGTGVGMPLGILTAGMHIPVAKEAGQAADTVISENIVKMWSRLWNRSRSNAVWMIHQDVLPQLMQLTINVGTGGIPVYTPPGGFSQAPYGTIFGRPVLESEYCQTVGDVGDIILADWSEYQMIEKGGIQSASSIHVQFVYDETVFRFVYRVDGEPKWNAAMTPKNGTNTVQPFVALAERA